MHLWILKCGNIVLLTIRFFDVIMFTLLTPLSLLIQCKLPFQIVRLKRFPFSTFALKSPNKMFVCYWGMVKHALQSLTNAVLCISHLPYFLLSAHSEQYHHTVAPCGILPLTNFTRLAAGVIPFCEKKPVPTFPPTQKKVQSPAG